MSGTYSSVYQDVYKKIEREKNIIQGASNLKKKTDNVMVIQKCNTNIREARQNIEYLEETLRKLDVGQHEQSVQSGRLYSTDSTSSDITTTAKVASKHVFSRFDLVKYDCPSLSERIQYMLQQLEFKLQVERQYCEANAKLTRLYQIDGDQRSSSAAKGGALESKSRIQLLTKALKKYQAINVNTDSLKQADDADLLNINQPKFRRQQLSGILTLGITAVRDVDHIQSPMFSRKPESFITVKIDDTVKAKSKGSRTDRWNEEFHIHVGKGNEVELTIHDKVNDVMTPVAVIWFLLSDVAEEIRKKKVGKTSEQQGWVDASRVISLSPASDSNNNSTEDSNPHTNNSLALTAVPSNNASKIGNAPVANTSSGESVTTHSWFILEPAGQILLTLGFDKTSTPQKKNLMGGLHRHGAIINRNEEVYEQHGHHFIQKSFYNIMCCAYCGEFLRYSGFQCQDCKFLCHRKCYTNVVTKCIAKASTNTSSDEAKLNHHIPHRFESVSNRGTKWCCHCGYILPWGRHKVRKCVECGVMCHAQCAHLVPDFCGMSMEMANKVLKTIQDTKRTQAQKKKVLPATLTQQKYDVTAVNSNISSSPYKDDTISQFSSHNQSGLLQTRSRPSVKREDSTAEQQSYSTQQVDKQSNDILGQYDRFNNFIEENQAYLNFTEGAEDTASKKYNSSLDPNLREQDFVAGIRDYVGTNMHQQEASMLEEEEQVWADQRHDMEQELRNEQQDSAAEAKTKRLSLAHEEPQILPVNSPNPFRDMNKDTFFKEQDEALSKLSNDHEVLLQEEEGHSPRNAVNTSPQKSHASTKHKKRASKRRKVSLDDFVLLKVLGKGNFGKVLLSKSKNTNKICAIKVLKKDHIIQNHDIQSARAEKKVFLLATKTKHPFLTNLYCSFQTENRIYFAMEFIGGGDLMWHVQNQRLSVRRAKFYAAEVLLALKYFHDNGVIYRDLKLENILLTPEGHIKIADYGLCKDDMWYGHTTATFCGTPEFMAPEILKEQRYTKAVDWWAFGVLLYQMLLCQSPFSGDDEDEVFNAILTDEPLYPIDMAGDIVQIFQGLLTKDPERRLGAGPRDALEIMEEPFFRNINFEDILNLKVEPPYIPKISSPEDTSYFEQEFTSAPPTLTPLPSVLSSAQQEEFRGFSFMPDDLEL